MIDIRPLEEESYALAASWLSEPATNRWLSSMWRGRRVSVSMLSLVAKSDRNRLYLIRADGTPCGLVGLAEIDRADGNAMIWYLVGVPGMAGKGAATAGIDQAAKLAFGELGLQSLHAWIMEDNAGSRRALEKNGFQLAGRLRQATRSGERQVDRLYYDLLPAR